MQKPSVRPARSPRERPTGAPQSEREQKRFRSGTSGCSITAVAGLGRGTPGTVTRPAPSLLRAEVPVDGPELRTETERALPEPVSERERRPETERRDVEEREERDEAEERPERADPADEEPLSLRAPAATPVAGEEMLPFTDTTGASPQVSQYSSPPPMSS
ncbi:hypothetical protein GCM10010394_49690 [Streptomyces crystallinus]|uniref:Uncharacterized protein n=1 Tax=Streptomyces crystallinus TaxID=68191 RepID=A0ABN1GL72_9ACTN